MLNTTAIGNLGSDPETKTTKNGKPYITFSIGVSTGWGDNKKTQWVRAKKYGENTGLLNILKKGTKVAVNGNLEASVFKEQPQLWLVTNDVHILSKPPEKSDFNDVKTPEEDDVPFDTF